jgi:hypothetical protein
MRTTTLEPLSSSDARAAIRMCHEELRGLVTETVQIADGASRSSRDCGPLRAHALELYEALEQHVDFEERILPTALRDVIGLGSMLHAQIEECHARQRALLAHVIASLLPEDLPRADLVDSVHALADAILLDLSSEEQCLLTADVDALVTDGHGG